MPVTRLTPIGILLGGMGIYLWVVGRHVHELLRRLQDDEVNEVKELALSISRLTAIWSVLGVAAALLGIIAFRRGEGLRALMPLTLGAGLFVVSFAFM